MVSDELSNRCSTWPVSRLDRSCGPSRHRSSQQQWWQQPGPTASRCIEASSIRTATSSQASSSFRILPPVRTLRHRRDRRDVNARNSEYSISVLVWWSQSLRTSSTMNPLHWTIKFPNKSSSILQPLCVSCTKFSYSSEFLPTCNFNCSSEQEVLSASSDVTSRCACALSDSRSERIEHFIIIFNFSRGHVLRSIQRKSNVFFCYRSFELLAIAA